VGNSQQSVSTDSASTESSCAEIIQHGPYQFSIKGTVDFATVPGLLKQAQNYLKVSAAEKTKQLVFDLSQIKTCNSAALALILEMIKLGKQVRLSMQFENMPDSLLRIAKAYGIETEIRDFLK